MHIMKFPYEQNILEPVDEQQKNKQTNPKHRPHNLALYMLNSYGLLAQRDLRIVKYYQQLVSGSKITSCFRLKSKFVSGLKL